MEYKKEKVGNTNRTVDFDFASLYPSSMSISKELLELLKRTQLIRARKEKLEKLNNL